MISIRHAINTDSNSLSKLAKLCFTDTFGRLYSKDNLLSHLEETCSPKFFRKAIISDEILLAEDDEKMLGYIKFGGVDLPVENLPKNSVEIHRLYVHPKFKNQGIGKSLMQAAFNNPMLQAAEHYYLSVYEDNISAQNFYKSYGFTKVAEYNYYVGSHIDREFIMHKKS